MAKILPNFMAIKIIHVEVTVAGECKRDVYDALEEIRRDINRVAGKKILRKRHGVIVNVTGGTPPFEA